MNTITIPKKITKGEELLIIPRKEYEALLMCPKIKKLDQGLEKALRDVRMGRVFGPFKTVSEFKKAIKRWWLLVMKIYPTERFIERYKKLSPLLKKKTDKALNFLLKNLIYPSLKAKKYDETRGIWQARIDQKYRFYFLIEKDNYILLDIKRHK